MKMNVKVYSHTLLLNIVTTYLLINLILYLILWVILKYRERKVVI